MNRHGFLQALMMTATTPSVVPIEALKS